MKSRIVLCTLLVAVVAVVPTAAAQPQRAQVSQDAADGVVSQIATAGLNAAVTKWAPEYYKDINPTGAALQAIAEQLAQLDTKLTELIDHQRALGERLSCETQRVALGQTLSNIQSWYLALREQRTVTDPASRKANLNDLFAKRHEMHAAQLHLHNALVGNNLPNMIRSCAKHIEETERPFLSVYLEREVWNFWSLYRTAAAELLVVRVNMVALHPEQFPANKAEEEARIVERYFADERTLIKPPFPGWMSYDEQNGILWQFDMIPYQAFQTGIVQRDQSEGWWVTGFNDVPTCSWVEAEFRKSGYTGDAAISWMYTHRIMHSQGQRNIICYDDHGRLHEFSLRTYTYIYAGDVQSYAPAVVARPNHRDGKNYINVSHYSYIR